MRVTRQGQAILAARSQLVDVDYDFETRKRVNEWKRHAAEKQRSYYEMDKVRVTTVTHVQAVKSTENGKAPGAMQAFKLVSISEIHERSRKRNAARIRKILNAIKAISRSTYESLQRRIIDGLNVTQYKCEPERASYVIDSSGLYEFGAIYAEVENGYRNVFGI